MDFEGKVVLITGSTSGIGAATAALFASRGAHVLVTGRDPDRGREVVADIRAAHGEGEFLPAVLSDAASARDLAARATEVAGRVDVLINNAAIASFGSTGDMTERAFEDMYAINVKVPYFLVGALAPAMAQRASGIVVNVTTMVAGFGAAGSSIYASSKAALNALTKSWAAEYGPHGVRVNAVAPGPTYTEGTRVGYGVQALERLASRAPARRVADAAEIARVIAFLASDEASFIHGVVLNADGGRGAV
ncbi:Short-chain dehydrogenase [Frankia sp. AiPs1]|uniref:SDR family NAD(P)-dependent oxidoreductase n=1 Tax=Frankia sp. AiPa1 TaxID=573492 RepID=UPI00202B8278|nr:SDR family oxidoreductase [Frankia sp. AiPa1]MCL9761274.1 SDR family oxidoreductase [Frankia sp. AiPa1]